MPEIELLNRKLEIARQISADARLANDPHQLEYAERAYMAWQDLEVAKRALNYAVR
ncbi:MAG TPA: hypothetical protein VFI23_05095 [Rhizomicrobium sp.]|nr:hypothetical protein [Rhizomicrobium sp.]